MQLLKNHSLSPYLKDIVGLERRKFFSQMTFSNSYHGKTSVRLRNVCKSWGAWGVWSVSHPTQGFSSGCDLRAVRSNPEWGSMLAIGSA